MQGALRDAGVDGSQLMTANHQFLSEVVGIRDDQGLARIELALEFLKGNADDDDDDDDFDDSFGDDHLEGL